MNLRKLLSEKYLLALVIILFLLTRVYKISDIPVSLYWDEASIGYNAYSVLKTGKDEWGDFLPLHFRAFGEFKLPVYIYSVTFAEFIFGLNEIAVRIPAVFYSLGVIILTFLLTRKLFDVKTALWSSFFVTIIPWFFIFSRTGYEATAGLLFYLVGIYFFLFLKRFLFSMPLAAVSFILSIYSYNSFRIIIPLTIVILGWYQFHRLMSLKNGLKAGALSIILFLISWIPIYRLYMWDAGGARVQAVGETKVENIFSNYMSYFSPGFLLIEGDKNLRSHIGYFGQLSLPIFIFFLAGLVGMLKSRQRFLLLLLLAAPISGTLTKEAPHALRAISAAPLISIIAGFGVVYIEKIFKSRTVIFSIVVTTFCLIFFANYFFYFLTEYPHKSAPQWQFAYKEIFNKYNMEVPKKESLIISDEFGQPYIFALFYLKYDPDKFREEVIRNEINDWGFSTVKQFNGFIFRKISNNYEN